MAKPRVSTQHCISQNKQHYVARVDASKADRQATARKREFLEVERRFALWPGRVAGSKGTVSGAAQRDNGGRVEWACLSKSTTPLVVSAH